MLPIKHSTLNSGTLLINFVAIRRSMLTRISLQFCQSEYTGIQLPASRSLFFAIADHPKGLNSGDASNVLTHDKHFSAPLMQPKLNMPTMIRVVCLIWYILTLAQLQATKSSERMDSIIVKTSQSFVYCQSLPFDSEK